jgi:tetratricopeptide (TPR) repeat protein
LICAFLTAAPAAANDQDTCNRSTGDTAIAACSRAIASGRVRGRNLAVLFSSRGVVASRDKGDHDRAIADLDEAIRLDPKLAGAFNGRGYVYNVKSEHDRAIADFNEAIRLDPKFALAFSNRGFAYAAKGDQDRAIADYSDAIRLDPKNAVAVKNRGDAYYAKGDKDRAIADYNEAIRLDPRLAFAFNSRGNVYHAKGDYDRAIADYSEAIRLSPADANLFNNRGNSFNSNGDKDRAIADYSEAIRLKPSHALAFYNRANVHAARGDDDRAIADYGEAVRLDPKLAVAFEGRGKAYSGKGDHDLAIADFAEAIRLRPAPGLFLGRGVEYDGKGDHDRAIADFDEAIRLDPKLAAALINRGFAHSAKGEFERAAADYAEAIRLDPKLDHAIGVRIQRVSAATAERLGLKQARGALVLTVAAGPARSAGIEPGDVIVRVDGKDINEFGELPRVLADKPLGKDIATTVFRNGSEETRLIRLGLQGAGAPVVAAPAPLSALPAVAAPAGPAIAERRIALVIGNSAYQAVSRLPNPANDAKAVADSLLAAGFAGVRVVTDATHDGMIRALRAFQDEADRADWAVVYYAGHGMEVGGINYLVPTDAHLKVDRDAQDEAVSLNRVLDAVAGARKLKLVMLDACRDNPFERQMRRTLATRAVSRGLVRVEPEGATLVVYAAKDGEVAEDGSADHSPFAAAFIKRIELPGVEINRLFRQVTGDVMQATGSHQRPFVYGSVPGDDEFFFRTR